MVKLLTFALIFIVLGVGVYFAVTKNLIPLNKVKTTSQVTPIQIVQPTDTPKLAGQGLPTPTASIEEDLTALEKDLNSLNAEDPTLTQDINNL